MINGEEMHPAQRKATLLRALKPKVVRFGKEMHPALQKMFCTRNIYFWLLIFSVFYPKMRFFKNSFIFILPHLLTTQKLKILMIHKEMHPVLRKNKLHYKCIFSVTNFGVFCPKNTNFQKSFIHDLAPPTN